MTARVGAEIHPEARELLTRALPAAVAALAQLGARPAAIVLVAQEHPAAERIMRLLDGALRRNIDGNGYAAVPLAKAQVLADELAPDVAPALREPVATGEVWCLVLRSPVGSAAVPVTPFTTRGSKAQN